MSRNLKQLSDRQRLIDAAAGWLKTPWHHKARVKGCGVDCAQLIVAVYAEAGFVQEFETQDYSIDHMLHSEENSLCAVIESYGGKLVQQPEPGDIVVWKFGKSFSHAGIIVEWPERVIHAYRPFGCVCETPGYTAKLKDRELRFYSLF